MDQDLFRPADHTLVRQGRQRLLLLMKDLIDDTALGLVGVSLCGAALLVLGTHGRGEVGGLILGSVSQRAIRQAHCPVAVVRATAQHRVAQTPTQGGAGTPAS